jgi:cell division protein ZapA
MAQVVVEVNGRPYTMQCADGEEPHLRDLANALDAEVAKIRQGVGAVGDIRLLLMAGLMVADQLAESQRTVEGLQEEITGLRKNRSSAASDAKEVEDKVAERLNNASMRLETLAAEMVARG